jgi:chorismate-pyruvate lyase
MAVGSARTTVVSDPARLLAPLVRFYRAAGRTLPNLETIAPAEVPTTLRDLLRAADPLTPRLEDRHGASLRLRVLERRRQGNVYARRVVLVREGDGVPVVLGAIEIHLDRLAPALRAEVLAERVPFGHIVADATAAPDALLRVVPDASIAAALAIDEDDEPLYGRCRTLRDGEGAVVAAIVEILAPELSPIRHGGCRARA